MASKLTYTTAKAAKPKDKEYLLADGRQGLYLRILPSGGKSWIYKFKLNGQARKITIAQFEDMSLADARDAHAAKRQIVRSGLDPSEPPTMKPDELTVAKLIEVYAVFSKENKAKSTSDAEKWGLTRYVEPVIGNRLVKEIRRPDAIKLIEAIIKGGMAAQVLKYARSMFQYALNRELVEFNPFSSIGSTVPAAKSKSRSRALTDDEIKHLWNKLSAITDPRSLETRRALLLILTTGQRPEEVTGMHQKELLVGLAKPRCIVCRRCGWWTIQAHRIKTRDKREEDHLVYLSPVALEIIGEGTGYIFKAPKSDEKPLLRQALSHFVVDHDHFGLPHWTPHDLRRTAATGLARIGCADEIIDAILNHSKKGIIATYNRHNYMKEKRLWLSNWSEHLYMVINSNDGTATVQ